MCQVFHLLLISEAMVLIHQFIEEFQTNNLIIVYKTVHEHKDWFVR